MFERFTDAARSAVTTAVEHARQHGHPDVSAGDLLLGTIADDDEVASRVVRSFGIDPAAVAAQLQDEDPHDADALAGIGVDLDAVRRRAEQAFGPGALDRPRRQRRTRFGSGHLPLSPESKSALEQALRAAVAERHHYLGTGHLLLGLTATEHGTALSVLGSLDPAVDRAAIRARVLAELREAA